MKKKALGKGLDAVISDRLAGNDEEKKQANDKSVPRETFLGINLIEPNKKQPRKDFEEEALKELAESIRVHGIVQPLVVQKRGIHYEIVAGERRWRAARIAGLKELPVVIRDYTEKETLEIALIENIQRQDLNPIEEAQAFRQLIEEHHLKQEEAAERVGKSRVAIANSMRLLNLDERVQELVITGQISGGHAKALLAIKDKDKQYSIAKRIAEEKLSVRETERLIKKLLEQKQVKKNTNRDDDVFYRDMEENLKQIIGSKVNITRKANNKGKIEIEYYCVDDLERIASMLLSK